MTLTFVLNLDQYLFYNM